MICSHSAPGDSLAREHLSLDVLSSILPSKLCDLILQRLVINKSLLVFPRFQKEDHPHKCWYRALVYAELGKIHIKTITTIEDSEINWQIEMGSNK